MIKILSGIGIKKIILSWDTGLSVVFVIIVALLLPENIANNFAKDLYSIGISVLSIIFAVYFAALAIVTSSGSDGFIKFLEETENSYTLLINMFAYSLIVLFFALLYSLLSYGITSFLIERGSQTQSRCFMIAFSFFFSYGLLSAFFSTLDSIKFAEYRSMFYSNNHGKEESDKPKTGH